MIKKAVIILIILFVVGISGCTTKTATNGTFGEKVISIDSIYILNNTTSDHYNYNDTEYFYIEGYIQNNNENDAFHVKINSTAYDANGNMVATNNSAYLEPTSLPGRGISYFYVEFKDPDKKIVRYDVKLVDAKGML